MSLNIKNERTHALVRRLAELTGQSQTSAVEQAVERQIAEVLRERERDARAAVTARREIDRLLAEFRADLTTEDRERLRTADAELYDGSGLPR